jgi:2-polyprenyl-3-methyl-5-hydroxy-6-metoxy-1,4-benzoquinol methylase
MSKDDHHDFDGDSSWTQTERFILQEHPVSMGADDHNWRTFFDHHASLYMQEPFVAATLAEVEFLIAQLHLTPGMRVLDMGCGTGRHAVELAKRGMALTGVDISGGMLAEAQKAADAAGVRVEWVQSPAQAYHATVPFDASYSVCEGALSLLGLDEPFDRDLSVLAALFAALKPGGRAFITVLNGMRYLRLYTVDDIAAGRFDPLTMVEQGTMAITTPDGARSIPTRERGYIPTELRLMLMQVGFIVELIGGGTAGNWRLSAPELDEMELLALMHRPSS